MSMIVYRPPKHLPGVIAALREAEADLDRDLADIEATADLWPEAKSSRKRQAR
jgi:hypothetical protein